MRSLFLLLALLTCSCSQNDTSQQSEGSPAAGTPKLARTDMKVAPSSGPIDLSLLAYDTEVVSFGKNGRQVRLIKHIPDYALRFADGILLGGNRGEWGGELIFRDKAGIDHRILDENVQGIFEQPTGAVVLTGLAHMSTNEGSIYELEATTGQEFPQPKLIHKLVGSPRKIMQTTAKTLEIRVDVWETQTLNESSEPSPHCYLLGTDKSLANFPCSREMARP